MEDLLDKPFGYADVCYVKRDFELVKRIFLFIEEHHDGEIALPIRPSDVQTDRKTFIYHFKSLIDKGMIYGQFKTGVSVDYDGAQAFGLTWEGHDFLAHLKKPQIWEKAKAAAGDLSWTTLMKVIEELSLSYARNILGT